MRFSLQKELIGACHGSNQIRLCRGGVMRYRSAALSMVGVLVAGCAQISVGEVVLSTNQKVAMISTPGDSVSPPTNLVLLADRNGQYAPVATGFGQAPVPAFLAGAGAGIAVSAGIYGAAKAAKPQVTNISSTNVGGNTNSTNTSSSSGNVNTLQSNTQFQNLNANASNAVQAASGSNTIGP